MVPSDKALPARAYVWISEILTQLYGLGQKAMSVAQIRSLRVAAVSAEALDPTGKEESVR